jgi:hypothetical protein
LLNQRFAQAFLIGELQLNGSIQLAAVNQSFVDQNLTKA